MQGKAAFFAYRMLARFAEILPASSIIPISCIVAKIGMLVFPKKAELVRSHIARVKGSPASGEEVRKAFASYVRYWLEALRLPIVPQEILERSVHTDGFEHIEKATREGKGIILAVPHVGNWDIAGAWLVKQGIPLTVVVEKLEPPQLRRWFGDFRESLGMRVLVNEGNVGTELMNALRRNESVALLCDRDVDKSGLSVEFFGENTTIPKGPAMLALRSGAALIPAAAFEDGKRHNVVIGEPIDVVRNGKLRDNVEETTVALTARIEDLIRRHPEQWHLFRPNWPSEQT